MKKQKCTCPICGGQFIGKEFFRHFDKCKLTDEERLRIQESVERYKFRASFPPILCGANDR